MKTLILMAFVLGASFTAAFGASFSCSKASTKVEKLVCDDPDLSSMDEQMAYLYRMAISKAEYPGTIKREQRKWINGDRNTCHSKKCLQIAYAARIEALGSDQNYEASPSSRISEPVRSERDSYAPPRSGTLVSDEVALIQNGGVLEVPVIVNEVLKINFIIDSGASDVSISPDVALTLLKTGTISQSEWLPGAVYTFADGSSAKSARFRIKSLRLGNRVLRDTTCSIAQNIEAPMLLGQSALQKLGSYQIDYRRGTLIFR